MDKAKKIELIENICDNFCKYSGTGEDGFCSYCAENDNKCPLDELAKEVEE